MQSVDANYFLKHHPCEWHQPVSDDDFNECCEARSDFFRMSNSLREMAFNLPGWMIIYLIERRDKNAARLEQAALLLNAPV